MNELLTRVHPILSILFQKLEEGVITQEFFELDTVQDLLVDIEEWLGIPDESVDDTQG